VVYVEGVLSQMTCSRRRWVNESIYSVCIEGALRARGKPFQVTTLIAGKEVVRIGSHDLNTSCVERWVLEDLERFSLSVVTRPFKDSLSLTHCAHGWCAVVAQVSCSTIKHNEFDGPPPHESQTEGSTRVPLVPSEGVPKSPWGVFPIRNSKFRIWWQPQMFHFGPCG